MRRLPTEGNVVLRGKLLEATLHSAKNTLITCALAFGRPGGGERAVLFAVAQSYSVTARTLDPDGTARGGVVDIDDLRTARTKLASAEERLCTAAKALSGFGRNLVGRLVAAASAYARASEIERSCAARVTNRYRRREGDLVLRPRPYGSRSSRFLRRHTTFK
jgi:hypothetical protein